MNISTILFKLSILEKFESYNIENHWITVHFLRSLIEFIDEFNSTGNSLMEYLRELANGKQTVTLLNEFNKTTLKAIASVDNFSIFF